jgi:hypothetical protein
MMAPALKPPRPGFLIFTVLGLLGVTGCGPGVATKPAPTTPVARSSDALESVREAVKKQVGTHSYRNALQQLNTTFAGAGDKPAPLTGVQRQFLTADVGVDDDELAEIASPTFTALDASYLDQCFLLRDAVRSFDVNELMPLARAQNAFAWVVRQVRLQEKDAEPLPPAFVLRRGWGTSLERSFLYLAVLHQMGLDGCLHTYPVEGSGQGISRYWIPGVRIDKDVYLFDTRLGMPLPSPKGKGSATLAEVRDKKGYFDQFTIGSNDDRYHYDLTPDQIGRAEILLSWPLSALAPRMKYLEELLASMNTKIRLSADPVTARKPWDEAGAAAKVPVRLTNRLGDYSYPSPLRTLRDFLPPSEGGVDPSTPPRTRQLRAQRELFPMGRLPRRLLEPPYGDTILVLQLQLAYARLFVDFPLPAARNLQIQELDAQRKISPVGVAREPARDRDDLLPRFVQYLLDPSKEGLYFTLGLKTPRDDMLRGRWEEATAKLVQALEQVRFQKSLSQNDPELMKHMGEWLEKVVAVQADYQRAAKAGGDLDQIQKRIQQLWVGGLNPGGDGSQPSGTASDRLPPWLPFVVGVAADPMGAEATYLLALCKHEQAERAQARLGAIRGAQAVTQAKTARDAWETTVNWWRTYLNEYPAGAEAAAARLGYARALEALGQREQAREALSNLAGQLSPLDETARLYRAKQLK